jgi:hypothetical protein
MLDKQYNSCSEIGLSIVTSSFSNPKLMMYIVNVMIG